MSKISISIECPQLDEKALENLAVAMIPAAHDWKEGCSQITGAKPAFISIEYPNQIDSSGSDPDPDVPEEEELTEEEEQQAIEEAEQEEQENEEQD